MSPSQWAIWAILARWVALLRLVDLNRETTLVSFARRLAELDLKLSFLTDSADSMERGVVANGFVKVELVETRWAHARITVPENAHLLSSVIARKRRTVGGDQQTPVLLGDNYPVVSGTVVALTGLAEGKKATWQSQKARQRMRRRMRALLCGGDKGWRPTRLPSIWAVLRHPAAPCVGLRSISWPGRDNGEVG